MQEANADSGVRVLEMVAQGRRCSRCGTRVSGGLTGPLSFHPGVPGGTEIPIAGATIVLCPSCGADVEASVDSYGEGCEERRDRFVAILRRFQSIG